MAEGDDATDRDDDATVRDGDATDGGDGAGPDRTVVRRARATLRTAHADPAAVAAALAPDNTDEMGTGVADDPPAGRRVVTTVDRPTAAGLRSTVDDYLVNLDVADRVAGLVGDRPTVETGSEASPADRDTDSDTNPEDTGAFTDTPDT